MNIAIYWEQYSWGGVDTYLRTLISNWPDKEHRFVVYSNQANEGLKRIHSDLEKLSNVEVKEISVKSQAQFTIQYKNLGILARILGLFFFPFFLFQNFWILNKTLTPNFDLLISQNGSYPGGWSCLIVLIVAKLKAIKTRVLVIHHDSTKKRRSWFFLEWLIDSLVVSSANKIIAVSEASLQSYIKQRHVHLKKNQGVVIYNGIEPSKVISTQPLFSQGEIKIGLLGRCEERKGHFDLIKALGKVNNEIRSKFHVYFIGACEPEFKIQIDQMSSDLQISENVHIVGYMPNSPAEIISSLDLLCCLTQDYEGFGLTVIEAMSVNVPVLSTNVGALKEFLVDGVNCYNVPAHSPEKIAEKLEDFAFHQNKWRALIKAGKETANRFSASNMAKNYFDLLIGKEE